MVGTVGRHRGQHSVWPGVPGAAYLQVCALGLSGAREGGGGGVNVGLGVGWASFLARRSVSGKAYLQVCAPVISGGGGGSWVLRCD